MAVKKRKVRKWLKFYQKLLGLSNWEISVTFCSQEHFMDREEGENYLGMCGVTADWQRARLQLLRLNDPRWNLGLHDVEKTLVHELLHVRWYFLEVYRGNKHFSVLEEQAISAEANALVTLKKLIDGKAE